MTAAKKLNLVSVEDYLAGELVSPVKHEYLGGVVYAMAGGTPAHAELSATMLRLLGNALHGRCRVHTSDLKVRIEATDLSTFPDVSLACEERIFSTIDRMALTNPTLVVEVTSK